MVRSQARRRRAAAVNAVQSLAKSRPHHRLRSCGAVGHSPMAECLHSALKMIVRILNVLVPRPAIMEKQKKWANTAACWIFKSGETSMDVANCQ